MLTAIVNRQALVDSLTLAAGASCERYKPILGCVRLWNDNDHLAIACTNLEIQVIDRIPANIESAGVVCVPAELLLKIVKASTSDTVKLIEKLDGETPVLGLVDDDSVFTFYTQPPEEFPPVPGPIAGTSVTVPAADFTELARQTAFCMARETTRYAFNGTLIGMNGDFRLVATDGRRLALAKRHADKSGPDAHAVATANWLALATSLTKKRKTQSVTVTIEAPQPAEPNQSPPPRRVELACDGTRIVGVEIEGHFPPYEDFITRHEASIGIVATEQLARAASRAKLMTSPDSKGMAIHFIPGGGAMIQSKDPSAGKATIALPMAVKGNELTIGFNPAFLADALKVCGADEVTLHMTAPNRHMTLAAGEDFTYVLMPVNLE